MPLSDRTTKTVVKGREYPLGATVVDNGVHGVQEVAGSNPAGPISYFYL
jgi:hypothetical protein